jgi:hypothetical protein
MKPKHKDRLWLCSAGRVADREGTWQLENTFFVFLLWLHLLRCLVSSDACCIRHMQATVLVLLSKQNAP